MSITAVNTLEGINRRDLMKKAGAFGMTAAGLALIAGCGGSDSKAPSMDSAIINAAATAEALASVMYDNLIQSALYTSGLAANTNDKAYLVAGRQQEAIHYATLVGAGASALALNFYFSVGMFSGQGNYQTAINTLITLEDAFIAAYLIGVRDLSTAALKVLAAQILGVESEHRAFGRVIAADLGLLSTTGLSGVAEMVNGPGNAANNLGFERTFRSKFSTIADVVTVLGPFVTPPTAGAAGAFDPTKFSFNIAANFYLTEAPSVTLDMTTP